MVIILMGVSGCGKTTTGKLLSRNLGLPYFDADDFHPDVNIKKMSAGISLNDDDRKPWLQTLSEKIMQWNKGDGAVLACSALKQSYREILQSKSGAVTFIWLDGSFELIESRMQKRKDHYMPPGLLQSQFDALEPPTDAIRVSINQPPESILSAILQKMKMA
jgi:carbohydrate kinase (thermoresistant glucokinase family)